MINNKKGFTLLELIVVILVIGIMYGVGQTFYNSIKKSTQFKKIIAETNYFNSLIENLELTDLYLPSYNSVEGYKELNNLDKDEFTDIVYGVNVIRPVLVNKYDYPLKVLENEELGNVNNDYRDITIGLQNCNYMFDLNSKTLSGSTFIRECDYPTIGEGIINIQGYIIGNNVDIVVDRTGYDFNNDYYFGNTFHIYNGDTDLVLDSNIYSDLSSLGYNYYDLLSDNFTDFYLNNFFIYKIKKLDSNIEHGIFYGTENDFTSLIKNEYIPGILNNSVLEPSDIQQDREDRMNMIIGNNNSIQFLYHDPNDFTTTIKEILPFGLNYNE